MRSSAGREAVVHLGHRDLLARVGDAGLRVRVASGRRDLGERRVVVVGVGVARAVAGDERQRLDVDRLVRVLLRVFGPHDDRGGRAVGHARAVVHAEPAGHERRVADRLHRDFFAELRTRVAGAVVVVLPRDAGEHLAHLLVVDAVLLAVAGRAHREHRGRGERAAGAVGRCLGRADEALVAAVLDLLDADRHRDVVRAARHRVRRVADAPPTPVAQKFSTWVTGLSWSCNGRASAMPLMPDIAVPSQYASMSSLVMPADANVSSAASISRSSVPLFQCSPNGVHPIPTMATWSLIPCEPICASPRSSACPVSCDRARFPEVVVDVVGGEQLAERHLHPVADLQRVDVDVDELHRQPAAAVEVDHGERDRRAQRVRDAVDGEQRDRALDLRHRRLHHVVDRVADA